MTDDEKQQLKHRISELYKSDISDSSPGVSNLFDVIVEIVVDVTLTTIEEYNIMQNDD